VKRPTLTAAHIFAVVVQLNDVVDFTHVITTKTNKSMFYYNDVVYWYF